MRLLHTSVTEEVISFSLVNHCAENVYFIDGMQFVEVNTCETKVFIMIIVKIRGVKNKQ